MSVEKDCPLCRAAMEWKPGKGFQGTVAKCCGVLWSYRGNGSGPHAWEVTGPTKYLKVCREKKLPVEFLDAEEVAELTKEKEKRRG
jgi:hypothetical protein